MSWHVRAIIDLPPIPSWWATDSLLRMRRCPRRFCRRRDASAGRRARPLPEIAFFFVKEASRTLPDIAYRLLHHASCLPATGVAQCPGRVASQRNCLLTRRGRPPLGWGVLQTRATLQRMAFALRDNLPSPFVGFDMPLRRQIPCIEVASATRAVGLTGFEKQINSSVSNLESRFLRLDQHP